MKITNKYNLPQSLVNVVSNFHRPTIGRYSASDIKAPPFVRKLKEEHWDELEQDVSDMLWLILGSATHYIIQGGAPPESLAEEKMTTEYAGCTIVCVPDLWEEGVITDWKITSAWSFILGDKPEWEKQLNIYKWMYTRHGFHTDKLQIHAILRDWTKSKALANSDYPQIAFQSVDVPVWDDAKTEKMIRDWIAELDLPMPCSDEERWARPTTWAVMENGRKTALRVLNSEDEAWSWLKNYDCKKGKTYNVVERPGEYIRCKSYCNVAPFCSENPYLKVAA